MGRAVEEEELKEKDEEDEYAHMRALASRLHRSLALTRTRRSSFPLHRRTVTRNHAATRSKKCSLHSSKVHTFIPLSRRSLFALSMHFYSPYLLLPYLVLRRLPRLSVEVPRDPIADPPISGRSSLVMSGAEVGERG